MKLQSKLISQLEELYEQEHGGCDSNTCDMQVAFEHGYTCWAIRCFSHSGASSDEFNAIYNKLNKAFPVQAERERKAFVKDVEHADCPSCSAVIWEPHWSGGYCSSCGKTHEVESEVS